MGRISIKSQRPPSPAEISAMDLKDNVYVGEKLAAGIFGCHRVTLRRRRRLGLPPAFSKDPATGSVTYLVGDLRAAHIANRKVFEARSPEAQRTINNLKSMSAHDQMLVEQEGQPDDDTDFLVDATEE